MKTLGIKTSALLLLFSLVACGNTKKKNKTAKVEETKKESINIPQFNADSAYTYIADQVNFGPRVPNSEEHKKCADYLVKQLERFGAEVIRQDFEAIGYDGTVLNASNIIGSYNPESKRRIALFSHWDTRPWADNDPNPKNHKTPVLGANDGASGVGVLLEIARIIENNQPELGIDIILFDVEDYGAPQFYKGPHRDEQWGLGSQYWSRIPHTPNYNARFGILLDMVGGKNATFYKEGYSLHYAKDITNKVWNQAKAIGYGPMFVDQEGGTVIDDHLFINRIANIKTVDIIPFQPENEQSSFGSTWHTLDDTLENIDKKTLKAVGETVLAVIYNEH